MGFYAVAATAYAVIPHTFLPFQIQAYSVAIDINDFPVVAAFHGLLAGCHALLALDKVFGSVQARSLQVHGFHWISQQKVLKSTRSRSDVYRVTKSRVLQPPKVVQKSFRKIVHAFSRRGLFGVESPHFETVMLIRKSFQILLQSYQGYALSVFMPRAWFNWLFVVTILVNCWAPIRVQRRFADDLPRARLVNIVLDIALDFLTLMVFPVTLVVPYYKLYDPDPFVQGFPWTVWYDDVWFINFFLEARLVFVTSWFNLAVKMLLGLNLLSGLDLATSLLDKATPSTAVIAPVRSAPAATSHLKQSTHRMYNLGHGMLALWGLGVLICHVAAAVVVTPPQCVQGVRPWFITTPSCSLFEFNCKRDQVVGTANEVDRILSTMYPPSLAYIIIRHCPALSIPPRIRQFNSLVGIKVHNSVLADWPTVARLNAHDHDRLRFLMFVDVNMTRLPDGLVGNDFPPLVSDIEFSISNLTSLPDNLDTAWPGLSYFILERAKLNAFPDVLTRMKIQVLSLGGNAISTVPAWVFDGLTMRAVFLNGNPIATLPELDPGLNVAENLYRIALDSTNVSSLPSWMTPELMEVVWVSLGNTPWCSQQPATPATEMTCVPLSEDDFTQYPLYMEKDIVL
ncbi:TPA: hypothetical protein N0F65_009582 [Lagenidium giganteum]|uniref:Leucine-rich repeat domain, L domain-like n=1 Tax=Lagenidium giganteum TaxID=4803 RepID=A0AAV2YF99_9STRA|nr:TPA: hypothetical protein N0F65_009582 [Lagenidium giganteum]